MNKILLLYENYQELMNIESVLKQVGFDVIALSSESMLSDQMLAFYPDAVICSGEGGRVSPLSVGKRLKDLTWWQGKSILLFPENFKPIPQDLVKIRVDLIFDSTVDNVRIVQVLANLFGYSESNLLERFHHPAIPERVVSKKVGHFAGSTSPLSQKERDIFFVTGNYPGPQNSLDLAAVEKELIGGGKPQSDQIASISEPAQSLVDPASAIAQESVRNELKKAQDQLSVKMQKYTEFVQDVTIDPTSTMNLVEVRKRQKELSEDWDTEKQKELDELRREFTVALVKK
jgi:hypothetical protein